MISLASTAMKSKLKVFSDRLQQIFSIKKSCAFEAQLFFIVVKYSYLFKESKKPIVKFASQSNTKVSQLVASLSAL